MSVKKAAFKGAAWLTLGGAAGQVLGFLRNVVVAHLLSPHEVGVAATLAITLYLVDLLADVSIDKLLIQAEDGDDPRFQGAAHTMLAIRGVIQSAVLFCISGLLASFFDLDGIVWAFRSVAIGPLVKGFAHLDNTRMQRELRFGPSIIADVVPQVVSFAAIFPLVKIFGDYRAMLFATLSQVVLYTICTHLTARRPYTWAWDGVLFKRIAAFGWPLMANGALLFLIGQGDKIVVGHGYTKAELAGWSNAMLLASAPMLVLGRVAVSVALPVMAKCRTDVPVFTARYVLCLEGLALIGAFLAVPMVLLGRQMSTVVFGDQYAGIGALIGLLGISQALRVCRISQALAALARGDSIAVAAANFARLLGVGFSVWLSHRHAPLEWLAAGAVGGEILAAIVGIGRLHSAGNVRASASIRIMVPFMAAVLACVILDRFAVVPGSFWPGLMIGLPLSVALVGGVLLPYRSLRMQLWDALHAARRARASRAVIGANS